MPPALLRRNSRLTHKGSELSGHFRPAVRAGNPVARDPAPVRHGLSALRAHAAPAGSGTEPSLAAAAALSPSLACSPARARRSKLTSLQHRAFLPYSGNGQIPPPSRGGDSSPKSPSTVFFLLPSSSVSIRLLIPSRIRSRCSASPLNAPSSSSVPTAGEKAG